VEFYGIYPKFLQAKCKYLVFIDTKVQENQYVRRSKLGVEHGYKRRKTIAIFTCDNCDVQFERELKNMHSKRMSNNYFHCCPNCDVKRFAQRKGVEHKKIWSMSTDADLPIDKI